MTRSTLTALSSLLMLLFYASLQILVVYACDVPLTSAPMVIGIAGKQFIAIYNTSGTVCVFQQPASGVSGGKAHLGKSGKEAKEVWPELELSNFDLCALITDSKGGHYIIFQPPIVTYTPNPRLARLNGTRTVRSRSRASRKKVASKMAKLGDTVPGTVVFDLDKKKVVSKNAKLDLPFGPVSSTEPMSVYHVDLRKNGILWNNTFRGDNVAESTRSGGDPYKLCASPESSQQMVAVHLKKGDSPECEKPLPLPEESTKNGFADDKNFYIFSNDGKVYTFEKSVVGDKLGKPVPYTAVDSKDFFIKEDVPGGGDDNGGDSGKSGGKGSGSTWLVIIIIIIVILLILAAVAIFCCFSKNKKSGAGKGGSAGKGGKGGGKSMKKGSKKSKKGKLKSSSKSLKSSRKSSNKFGSKKSSKKGATSTSRLSSRGKSKSVSKGATNRKISSRKSGKVSSKKSSKR